MYKRLSDEKLDELIAAGIREFAERGYDKANLSVIARHAGISVGVIYKYYQDKEALFLACVRYSLEALTTALKEAASKCDNFQDSIKGVIHTLIHHAKEHPEINRMYHEITSGGAKQFSKMLAEEVEGISALVYTDLVRMAQEDGACRKDVDPAMFAFFFDNLFMMLQFSYSCEYYRERYKLYCGENIFENDEKVEEELIKFLLGAIRA